MSGMRRIALLLTIGLVALAAAAPPALAAANGEFFFPCSVAHSSMDDPIVFPGVPDAAHMHDFVGNTSTDAYSTAGSLFAATTNCRLSKDKSAYWFPEVSRFGIPVAPAKIQAYYRNGVAATPKPFPFGLKMIQGDPEATSAQPGWSKREFWMCADAKVRSVTPPDCPTSQLVLQVIFPQCWDGAHLDVADHRSHMAYPVKGACPADHPVVVPRLQLQVKFDIHDAASAGGLSLSSGSIYGIHADFFNAWDPATLSSLIANCIAAGVTCHF